MTEQEFWNIMAAMPQPKPVFYRLYYRSDGSPLHYTMEDLPGDYIEIDRETYVLGSPWVRVIGGKLKRINRISTDKLVPSDQGTSCHAYSVAIVDPTGTKTWSKQTYGLEQS